MIEERRSREKAALERLENRLKEIRRLTVRFTVIVMATIALWGGVLFLLSHDPKIAGAYFGVTFQFLCVVWAVWFMLPYFMRMEAKQDLGLAMGHDSVDMMDRIDRTMEVRLAKVDEMVARVEKALDAAERGDHPLVKRVEAKMDEFLVEMRRIREAAERGATAKSDIGAALAEGEEEAARIREGRSGPCVVCDEIAGTGGMDMVCPIHPNGNAQHS